MGKKGEGEIKNLKKWVTSFMDGPTPSNFVFLKSYKSCRIPIFKVILFYISLSINLSHFFTAELGDYEEETHTAAFVSEFRFIPHQDEKFELDVLDQYKKLRYDYFLLLLFEKKCVEFA